MPEFESMLVLTIGLALVFDFSNGWHDSANAIATVVSTRVLSPLTAVLLAGVLNVAGAFFSTAVAIIFARDSLTRWKSPRFPETLHARCN